MSMRTREEQKLNMKRKLLSRRKAFYNQFNGFNLNGFVSLQRDGKKLDLDFLLHWNWGRIDAKLTHIVSMFPFIPPPGTGNELNVNKMFRRRPGHPLNVLCTFI